MNIVRPIAVSVAVIAVGLSIAASTLTAVEKAVTENTKPLVLHTRSIVPDASGKSASSPTIKEATVEWDPKKTALIICDMWDNHWCQGAARRVDELSIPMNALIGMARRRGVFIIPAPSTTVDFYKDTPQRKRAIEAKFAKTKKPLATVERWGTAWCYPDPKRETELPIDDTDMGCDCATKCEIVPPGCVKSRQSRSANPMRSRITQGVICSICGWLRHRQRDDYGVHLNMCVLGRPFAIRQLVTQGKNVVLIHID